MTKYQIPGLLVLLLLNIGSLPATAQHASCANSWTDPQTRRWECLDRKFAKAAPTSDIKPATAELVIKDVKVARTSADRDLYEVVGNFVNQGTQDRYLSYVVISLDYSGTPLQQLIVPVNAAVAAGKSISFSQRIGKENLNDLNPAMITATALKYEYR